jgi:heptosyltransferase-3
VRPNHRLGNTLLTTPAIDLFRRIYPDAEIDFLTAGAGGQLLQNLPLREVLVFRREFYWKPWRLYSFVRSLRRRRYDLAVDCGFGSRTDALMVALSGAGLKLGVENEVNGFLYNLRAPLPPRDLHKEEKWDFLAKGLGLPGPVDRMRVALSREEEDWAADWLAARGVVGPGKLVGVFIGARGRKGKRWPLDRFLELIRLLRAGGHRLLVFRGPEEAHLAGLLERELPDGALPVAEPSLRRAAALMARASLFISGDSGPMHLACALRVPVLAIFLKDNWRRWGPRPDRGRILTGGRDLSAQEVADAAREMLSSL